MTSVPRSRGHQPELRSYWGPHDGSSSLERALDELIDSFGDRLALVDPSGNSFDQDIMQVDCCRANAAKVPIKMSRTIRVTRSSKCGGPRMCRLACE